MKQTTSRVMAALFVVAGLATTAGCGTIGARAGGVASAMDARSVLDGRTFEVALAAERGGPSEKVEIAFKRDTLEASDASDQGYAPRSFAVRWAAPDGRAFEFEAELRSPGASRRFKGRVEGDQIAGTVMLVPDGAMPVRFTFDGHATAI